MDGFLLYGQVPSIFGCCRDPSILLYGQVPSILLYGQVPFKVPFFLGQCPSSWASAPLIIRCLGPVPCVHWMLIRVPLVHFTTHLAFHLRRCFSVGWAATSHQCVVWQWVVTTLVFVVLVAAPRTHRCTRVLSVGFVAIARPPLDT